MEANKTFSKKKAKLITPEIEKKWWSRFERQSRFVGNGVYTIAGLYSTDTRELFKMFIIQQEEF